VSEEPLDTIHVFNIAHDGGPLRGAEFLKSSTERYIEPILGVMRGLGARIAKVTIWSGDGAAIMETLAADLGPEGLTFRGAKRGMQVNGALVPVTALESIKRGDLLVVWPGGPDLFYAKPWGDLFTWMAPMVALEDAEPWQDLMIREQDSR